MRLYKDGINRNTDVPSIISDLKKAGYVVVVEEAVEVAEEAEKVDETPPVPVTDTDKPQGKGKVKK